MGIVVRREIMRSVICPSLYYGEDGAVVPQIIAAAESFAIIDKPLYNYYYRTGSVSQKPSPKACVDFVEAFRIVKSELPEEYRNECEYIGIKCVCYSAVLSAFKAGVSKTEVVKIIDGFEKDYPGWISNEYINNLGIAKKLYLLSIKYRLFMLVGLMSSMHDFYISHRKK